MKLRPWEQHTRQNTVDGEPFGGLITYWRRTDEAGYEVLTLGPEGLEESQCWAWMILPAIGPKEARGYRYGVNYGSHVDFDDAKRQADDAARALGYES